ncbi:MAG: zinc-ribbon domain-containing protein [Deltaproteobacteria bacterium]|nr:zinc-ribbon domain-containing protein [Deltaproteobacteria bacterium]
MTCPSCGAETRSGATFCPQCGARIEVVEVDETLAAALRELGAALAGRVGEGPLSDALLALADTPVAAGHTTVIVGEVARGKTSLVNQLLGEDVLPVGRLGLTEAVRIVHGPVWVARRGSRDVLGLPLRPPQGEGPLSLEGPAPILARTSLLDTPGLNSVAHDFDQAVIGPAAGADLLVICLAANQLLSETEREIITRRLLPVAGGEVALVVGFTDAFEEPEDREEAEARVRGFVQSLGRPVQAVFSEGLHAEAPLALTDLIAESADRRGRVGDRARASRLQHLLEGVRGVVMALEDPVDESVERHHRRVASARALLQTEASLALGEAETELRTGIQALRRELPRLVGDLSAQRLDTEGPTLLLGRVQALSADVGRGWLQRLELGLLHGSESLRAVGADLEGTDLGDPGDKVSVQRLAIESRPSSGLPEKTLLAAGAVAFMVGGPQGWVVSALTIATADLFRRRSMRRFRAGRRDQAVAALSEQLERIEQDLLGALRASSRELVEAIDARLAATPAPQPEQDGTTAAELGAMVARVSALIDLLDKEA